MVEPYINTVAVIDEATDAVVAKVPVGNHAAGLAVDSTTGRLYVANGNDGTITVIDEVTDRVAATIALDGTYPLSLGVDPDTGTVYSGDFSGPSTSLGSVAVIDEATNKVTSTISLGPNFEPASLGVDPKTGTVLVANAEATKSAVDDDVVVIGAATDRITSAIPVGHVPDSIGVNPLTGTVYVPSYQEGYTSVIDEATKKVSTTFRVAPRADHPLSVVVDPKSSTVYLIDETATRSELVAVDDLTDKVIRRIPVDSHPSGLAVDPGTDVVYVSNFSNDTVSVVHLAPPTVARLTPSVGPDSGGTRITSSHRYRVPPWDAMLRSPGG